MKKGIKAFGIIVFVVLFMVSLISCGPPRLKGTVIIEGEPMVGRTLTANFDSLGGSGIISYQWIRNGGTVVSKDSPTYILQDEDTDAVITITVTRSDNSGSVTSTPVKAYYGYRIGDAGPGGGIIFYRNPNGFTMTDTGETAYYLEAAPANMPTTLTWQSAYNNIAGTETAIGTGRKNTAIIHNHANSTPAATACFNFEAGGKDDWFLPSRQELNELNRNRSSVGNMGTSWYWSSSQFNNDRWDMGFASGSQGGNYVSKLNEYSVRAVRAF